MNTRITYHDIVRSPALDEFINEKAEHLLGKFDHFPKDEIFLSAVLCKKHKTFHWHLLLTTKSFHVITRKSGGDPYTSALSSLKCLQQQLIKEKSRTYERRFTDNYKYHLIA